MLGISISHWFSQKSFATSLKLPYPLLSDYPQGKTILAYDVGYYEGAAKRLFARQSFLLIDKEGIVRGRWSQPLPKKMEGKLSEVLAPDPLFPSEPILKVARKLAK